MLLNEQCHRTATISLRAPVLTTGLAGCCIFIKRTSFGELASTLLKRSLLPQAVELFKCSPALKNGLSPLLRLPLKKGNDSVDDDNEEAVVLASRPVSRNFPVRPIRLTLKPGRKQTTPVSMPRRTGASNPRRTVDPDVSAQERYIFRPSDCGGARPSWA
ncbi:hypothetical protein BU26DRAFT_558958 [Trematosphaeria pertusa]|uniref:Uncharacterized protein n=1 Tax=Trematosphaeria pertusa TaxID=390896 RepID=A0A6A6IUY3_9PLEO|nr:uncharacterized protein BU26DRAFT_558958 [Trematosphaeria pertusa]KAF2254254.1 hypothetical protein BU26DRAFT_558958 [Trematosphaeria pertusa]